MLILTCNKFFTFPFCWKQNFFFLHFWRKFSLDPENSRLAIVYFQHIKDVILSTASLIIYLWRNILFSCLWLFIRYFSLCLSAILLLCFRYSFILIYLLGLCRMSLIYGLMPFVSGGKFLTINSLNISSPFSVFSSLAL